jgi:hypothetical protein
MRPFFALHAWWTTLATVVAFCAVAQAQGWEKYAGRQDRTDVFRGVAEVRYCPGGGAIAAGTALPNTGPANQNPNRNLILERSDALGNTLWRHEYDNGAPEQAAAVVELSDGSGFATVGSIDAVGSASSVSRFVITRFDCDGTVLWQRAYGRAIDQNTGFDLIEARTGDPALGTSPGDLIALGHYIGEDGEAIRIVRTDAAGNVVWMNEYWPTASATVRFRAIAELPALNVLQAGELVAVGRVGQRAAVMEIDSATGALLCARLLPGLGSSEFHDVATFGGTQGGGEIHYVAVGETATNPLAAPDIFLARIYAGLACSPQRQAQWGQSGRREAAYAATPTLGSTVAGVPAGKLLLAGEIQAPWPFWSSAISRDAVVHVADPVSLMPLAGGFTGRRYGTQGNGAEAALAIAAGSSGAYLAGATTTDWNADGDSQDALLAQLAWSGLQTRCSVAWTPPTAILTGDLPLAFYVVPLTWEEPVAVPSLLPVDEEGFCCKP